MSDTGAEGRGLSPGSHLNCTHDRGVCRASGSAQIVDPLDCFPPCPVAYGRMGLLCTCGNAPKRLHAIFDRLDAQREDR